MPQIAKQLHEVRPEDLQAICDAAWVEDEQLDFKITVPHKKQPEENPWVTRQAISEYGRDDLLATVVAFANSYGGDLIIGIEEIDGNPGAAKAVAPVPACVDLAARLSQQANACVEPHLSTLEVRGLPLQNDGAGVVILRVAQSRAGPHRLSTTKDCYHRVRDETKAMTMRQIQDLTFDVARGIEKIEQRFAALEADFASWRGLRRTLPTQKRYSVRLSFVPMVDLYIAKVHDGRIACTQRDFNVAVGGRQQSVHNFANNDDWRPILRGTRSVSLRDPSHIRATLYCDGAYSIEKDFAAEAQPAGSQLSQQSFVFVWGWLMGAFCGGVRTLDAFRRAAGHLQAEYAAELSFLVSEPLPMLEGGMWNDTLGNVDADVNFPRYVVGATDVWTDLLTMFLSDLRNAVGSRDLGEKVELVR